jgi:hypothetical protein
LWILFFTQNISCSKHFSINREESNLLVSPKPRTHLLWNLDHKCINVWWINKQISWKSSLCFLRSWPLSSLAIFPFYWNLCICWLQFLVSISITVIPTTSPKFLENRFYIFKYNGEIYCDKKSVIGIWVTVVQQVFTCG